MTKHKSFKRLVRMRMDKTGESYTTARRALLVADEPDTASAGAASPRLVCPDATILERTGRGWEAWFDLLDEWGAEALTHREIAKKVAAELGIDPLAWNAQAVTTSYERAKGRRAVGQRTDGFAASVSRTIAAPVDDVFVAVADAERRSRWLPGDDLRERARNRTRSLRFDAGDDGSRVLVTLDAAAPDRTRVSIEHTRLADDDRRQATKARWSAALDVLKSQLEGGAPDASSRVDSGRSAKVESFVVGLRPPKTQE